MQERSQLAFVLHSRPYREQQVLVDFITEHEGKITAIGYSGHSVKSNKKALLQPFLPVNINLKGRKDLKQLQRIEAAGKSINLVKTALYSGFYINELLIKLLPDNIVCYELFQCYQQTLLNLKTDNAIEIALRQFELQLLNELGIAFDFSVIFNEDVEGFYYQEEQGFVTQNFNSTNPCYNTRHLQKISQKQYDDAEVLKTFKHLMRQVITQLLNGAQLHSRKLFNKK